MKSIGRMGWDQREEEMGWLYMNTMERLSWTRKSIVLIDALQRQTVVSQFFQLDRLVVEGGKTGKQTGDAGGIARLKDTG